MGVVLYNNYRGAQIEMACAGMPGWLTRETLAELFAYPFIQLGCWTVLTGVKRANAKAREFNRKLGFRELCAIPQAPQKTGDTILYCMTRDQCRWLKGERLH
jgi:L-amino acid N-acyltransferase YncA